MKTSKKEYPFPARRVYTACKGVIKDCGIFRSIHPNDTNFRITASRGLPIFGEDIKIKVTATSSVSCEVEMKSSDKLFFNIFKIGNNIRNLADLTQFFNNQIYRCCDPSSVSMAKPDIRIVENNIRFKS